MRAEEQLDSWMAEDSGGIRHDQLFKDLLRALFGEFMELFFADVALRLDLSNVTFLDTETFTDIPRGDQRDADLIAQVHTQDGEPEFILTHIEIETKRRSSFPERMFDYFCMLRLRHHRPIYPIVVYLSPGAGGLTTEQHVCSVFDRRVNVFTYDAVGLPDLQADDYQDRDNPLTPALSALMKPSRVGRVTQKYQSLLIMAQLRIDDARRALLTNVVETYLSLDAQEEAAFNRLAASQEGEEIRKMISVYEQRGIEQGIKRGIEQGIQQGIERGIEHGIAIGERQTLLRQLVRKFGELPNSVREHVEALSDIEELNRLADLILQASTLEEMGLNER